MAGFSNSHGSGGKRHALLPAVDAQSAMRDGSLKAENKDRESNLALSHDQGHSFNKPEDISGNVLDPNHPTLKIAQDEKLIAVFQGRQPKQNASDWNKTQAFLVEIDGSGRSSKPVALPASAESISYPTAAAGSGGRLFVTWTQPQGESQIAMLSRGRKTE